MSQWSRPLNDHPVKALLWAHICSFIPQTLMAPPLGQPLCWGSRKDTQPPHHRAHSCDKCREGYKRVYSRGLELMRIGESFLEEEWRGINQIMSKRNIPGQGTYSSKGLKKELGIFGNERMNGVEWSEQRREHWKDETEGQAGAWMQSLNLPPHPQAPASIICSF